MLKYRTKEERRQECTDDVQAQEGLVPSGTVIAPQNKRRRRYNCDKENRLRKPERKTGNNETVED